MRVVEPVPTAAKKGGGKGSSFLLSLQLDQKKASSSIYCPPEIWHNWLCGYTDIRLTTSTTPTIDFSLTLSTIGTLHMCLRFHQLILTEQSQIMIGLVIVVVSTSSIGRILFGKYILRQRWLSPPVNKIQSGGAASAGPFLIVIPS